MSQQPRAYASPGRLMVRVGLCLTGCISQLSCHSPAELPDNSPVEMIQQAVVALPSGFDATTILNDGPSVPSPIEGPTKMAIAPPPTGGSSLPSTGEACASSRTTPSFRPPSCASLRPTSTPPDRAA